MYILISGYVCRRKTKENLYKGPLFLLSCLFSIIYNIYIIQGNKIKKTQLRNSEIKKTRWTPWKEREIGRFKLLHSSSRKYCTSIYTCITMQNICISLTLSCLFSYIFLNTRQKNVLAWSNNWETVSLRKEKTGKKRIEIIWFKVARSLHIEIISQIGRKYLIIIDSMIR